MLQKIDALKDKYVTYNLNTATRGRFSQPSPTDRETDIQTETHTRAHTYKQILFFH